MLTATAGCKAERQKASRAAESQQQNWEAQKDLWSLTVAQSPSPHEGSLGTILKTLLASGELNQTKAATNPSPAQTAASFVSAPHMSRPTEGTQPFRWVNPLYLSL